MVNHIACQKQEAPNQKCNLEVSKKNLLLLMKKSQIIYQTYKLKYQSWGTFKMTHPYTILTHTPRPYFCLYGIMVEYSNLWVQIPSCHLYLKFVSVTFLLVCFVSLNEGTCETRRHVFYFILKAFLILEIIKF